MTPESSSSEAARPPERQQGRKKRYLAWRVAAVAVIILVMLGLAHFLRNPSVPWGGADSGDPALGQWPPEPELSGGAPPPARPPTTQREADQDMRRLMGGLVMAAIGDPDEPDDARHPDDEAKRQSIADLLGVPRDQLRNPAPADLMPSQAKVLIAFKHPDRREARMILVRMPGDLGTALEAFCKHYDARGWGWEELADPDKDRDAQPDGGWLVRFHKGKRERIVYARARSGGEETLVAIYDPRY